MELALPVLFCKNNMQRYRMHAPYLPPDIKKALTTVGSGIRLKNILIYKIAKKLYFFIHICYNRKVIQLQKKGI